VGKSGENNLEGEEQLEFLRWNIGTTKTQGRRGVFEDSCVGYSGLNVVPLLIQSFE